MFRILGPLLLALFLTGPLAAQQEVPPGERKQMTLPSPEAIDACTGKEEEAACWTVSEGAGACGYTPDKKYLACNPKRKPSGDKAGRGDRWKGSEDPEGPSNNDVREDPDGTMTVTF